MTTGYISVGSNINKEINIPAALKALKKEFGQLVVSSLYQSEAVGFEGDDFHNLIVQFETTIEPRMVAKILRNIESTHGRTRDGRKYAARTLDLDLILYGDQIIDDDHLQIPRHDIEQYAFVLEPLAEICPRLLHPISKINYATLWRGYNKSNAKQRLVKQDFVKP